MIKPSLRWEIIFTLIIAMVASSFLISLVVMSITKRSIIDQKIEASTALVNFFQHSADFICSGTGEVLEHHEIAGQLQQLVNVFTLEKDVKAVVIMDRTGRILASSEASMIGNTLHDEDLIKVMSTAKIVTRVPHEDQSIFRQLTDELSISAPLYLGDRVGGFIRMTLSLRTLQTVLHTSSKIIVFYIIFTAVIIIAFGSYLLSRSVVRPIRKLVSATDAIGKGDFTHSLESKGRNEVGQLSLAFSRMASRISEHQKELQDKIESLERLNRELQQSQNEVLAGEKLALVGKLAAGVAHEIGNPLSSILGYIGLLQRKEQHSPEASDYLRRIEQELLRINKTIRGLLDFSRLPRGEITRFDVRQVLNNTLALVAHQGSFRTIQLITRIEENLWSVEGDTNQLQQVLLNLLLNASEAVAEDGRVAVLADRLIWHDGVFTAYVPSSYLPDFAQVFHGGFGDACIRWEQPVPFVDHQPVVRLLVADNGIGVASEHLNKIFDPFFTTKEAGKGTGLGLAICTRIIASYGGLITARSELGRGSAFLTLLPGERIPAWTQPAFS